MIMMMASVARIADSLLIVLRVAHALVMVVMRVTRMQVC